MLFFKITVCFKGQHYFHCLNTVGLFDIKGGKKSQKKNKSPERKDTVSLGFVFALYFLFPVDLRFVSLGFCPLGSPPKHCYYCCFPSS